VSPDVDWMSVSPSETLRSKPGRHIPMKSWQADACRHARPTSEGGSFSESPWRFAKCLDHFGSGRRPRMHRTSPGAEPRGTPSHRSPDTTTPVPSSHGWWGHGTLPQSLSVLAT
jgi:hypothetical protein